MASTAALAALALPVAAAAGGPDIECEYGVPAVVWTVDDSWVVCGAAITDPADGDTVEAEALAFTGVGVPGRTVWVVDSEGHAVCSDEVDADGEWSCAPDFLHEPEEEVFTPFQSEPGSTSSEGATIWLTII